MFELQSIFFGVKSSEIEVFFLKRIKFREHLNYDILSQLTIFKIRKLIKSNFQN